MPDDQLPSTSVGRLRLPPLMSNADKRLLEEIENTPMALLTPQALKEWERMKSARVQTVKELDCE